MKILNCYASIYSNKSEGEKECKKICNLLRNAKTLELYTHGFYKKEKGITLIALVVTIVVLLILAGVSLNLVFNNNGIITKAGEAKVETRAAQVEDLVELYKSDNEISQYSGGGAQTEEELLQDLRTKKLVEDEEIYTENKTITIGTKVISYALPERAVDKTALKFLVNSGADGVVVLPVSKSEYGEDGYEVDWGDGTTGLDDTVIATKETELASLDGIKLAAGLPSGMPHTYSESNKEYEVTITGGCRYINSGDGNTTKDKIIEVLQWGETGLERIVLEYCVNLRKIASPTENSFANITNFNWAFGGCTSLTNIPADLFANCQNVTNFSYAFSGCTSLTNIPADLFANCPNVTDFWETFEGCTDLTNIPADLFANCSNVTNFGWTFSGCTKLTSIPADLFANCSNVTDFRSTFVDCTNLTGNAPELWKRVPDGETNEYIGTPCGVSCFYNCTNLTNYGKIPEYWKQELK